MDTVFGQFEIRNKKGLHARAAAKLVKLVEKLGHNIQIEKDGQTVRGDSIMGLLMLGAAKGSSITVTVSGPSPQETLAEIENLINRRFDEE